MISGTRTIQEVELDLLLRLGYKTGFTVKYADTEIEITEPSYKGEIRLSWKGDQVETYLFKKAWDKARMPRFPRHVPEENRYVRFEEFDPDNSSHHNVASDVIWRGKLDEYYSKYDRVLKEYTKLATKSPLAGPTWMEPHLREAFPWLNLRTATERLAQALNDRLGCSLQVTGYAQKASAEEEYHEYSVGNADDRPLIGFTKYTFGSTLEPVLGVVRVRLHGGLKIIVGPKTYAIYAEQQLEEAFEEIPHQIHKIWLEATDGLRPKQLCVNTLSWLILDKNENYDTEIKKITSAPFSYHDLRKALEPTDMDFVELYEQAVSNIRKEN